MAPKTWILIGGGNRGETYTRFAKEHGEFRLVALAEPIPERRADLQQRHGLSEAQVYESWEPLLAQPKMADAAVIATMDRDHFAPAMAAIECGYDILLEKPVSPNPAECVALEQAAKKKGVSVLVCHVLRYTPFFRALKSIIDSGRIGRVMDIQHEEAVGHIHQSHSFVRGNWCNSTESSPMLLQKSCHDMDILQWLIGKRCRRIHSFGSLSYFHEGNKPEGAPKRCIDGCPHAETCQYNAVRLYLDDKLNGWFRNAATRLPAPTDADVEHALRTTDYGLCVFQANNDVVDHQVVNMEFEDGVTCSFSMCAFTEGGRHIRIRGTRGELTASMGDATIRLFNLETRKVEQIAIADCVLNDTIVGGHGGGDEGIVSTFRRQLDGETDVSLADISVSVSNHMIAFAAEQSRLTGQVVDVEAFEQSFREGTAQ